MFKRKEPAGLWAAGKMGSRLTHFCSTAMALCSPHIPAPAPQVVCIAHKQWIVQCIQVSPALAMDPGCEWDLCVPVVRLPQTLPTAARVEFRLA